MISAGIRTILFSTIFLLWHSPLLAGSISIAGGTPDDRLAIKVENASAADILRKLGQRFDFQVQGLQKAKSGGKFSATLTGTLRTILVRILRNRNHMIKHSSENRKTIVRVVILDAKLGSATPVEVDRKQQARQRARSIAALRQEAAERRRAVQLRRQGSAASGSEPRQ